MNLNLCIGSDYKKFDLNISRTLNTSVTELCIFGSYMPPLFCVMMKV